MPTVPTDTPGRIPVPKAAPLPKSTNQSFAFMNEDAQKRLQAIQEFTELGSGYKIAQRDLMIRGAGDILGPEQAGFIDSIGLDLYLKLLNEAVKEKQTGIVEAPPKPNKMFQIDAYIPKDYAIPADKIELYQELEDVKNDKDLAAFSKKIRDIYGRIPDETKLLIQKKRIDLLSTEVEFKSIDETTDLIDILLSDAFSQVNGIGADLFNALLPYLSIVKVSFLEKRLRLRITKSEKWLDDLEAIMKPFGVGLSYSEMISDCGIDYGNAKTIEYLKTSTLDRPVGLQIFGFNADSAIKAIAYLESNVQYDILDVNLGCPVYKVVKTGAGSACRSLPTMSTPSAKCSPGLCQWLPSRS